MQEEYEEYNAVETEIVPCRRHLNLNDDLAYAEEKDLNDKGKNSIDDEDAGDGTTMRRWYATMVANGTMVDWEEFI